MTHKCWNNKTGDWTQKWFSNYNDELEVKCSVFTQIETLQLLLETNFVQFPAEEFWKTQDAL